jgi:hypothetical protein
MEGEQVEIALLAECLGGPAVLLRGDFDIAQDGADVNRLAAVTAVIFTEPFHNLRFTIYELRVKHQNRVNRKS